MRDSALDSPNTISRRAYAAEAALMVCFLFLLVGDLPPDVNEVHYLTKARYAWDPTFCPHDLFVTSPGAQPVFVMSLGWLTTVLGFSGAAWCGRLLAWLVFATGWQRVCRALRFGWGWGLFTLAFAAVLNEDLHMAGEWFVGGLEAKSLSYGCVIWALASLLEGGIGRTIACLGLAMGFHPLVGGWAAIAFAAAYVTSRRELGSNVAFKGLIVGLLIAVPCVLVSVIPLLRYDHGVDRSVVSKAHQIYVYTRLPHHLVTHLMRPLRIWRFAGLVATWAFLACASRSDVRFRLIHRTTAFALGIALLGWVIDWRTLQNPAWGGHLLRYYWFRLADVLVPWSVALVTGLALKQLTNRESVQGQALLAGCLVLLTWASLDSFSDRVVDTRPPADRQGSMGLDLDRNESESCFRAWLQLCTWAKNNSPQEALFLTPLRSQTFRWYSERSEYANWKDMPQNAAGIVEWSERIEAVSDLGLYDPESYVTEEQVLEFARARAIDYVIVLRRSHPRPWNSHPVLRNDWFSLYAVANTNKPPASPFGLLPLPCRPQAEHLLSGVPHTAKTGPMPAGSEATTGTTTLCPSWTRTFTLQTSTKSETVMPYDCNCSRIGKNSLWRPGSKRLQYMSLYHVPQGRPTLAHRFIGGSEGPINTSGSPGGTEEKSRGAEYYSLFVDNVLSSGIAFVLAGISFLYAHYDWILRRFIRPCGTFGSCVSSDPPINRWAIVGCPYRLSGDVLNGQNKAQSCNRIVLRSSPDRRRTDPL